MLDANVLASGFVERHSNAPSVRILDAWRAGVFELAVSEDILLEVTRTLAKPYFSARLTDHQVTQALLLLGRRARVVELSTRVSGIASHAEDDLVLSAAISAHADCLVTGDRNLRLLQTYEGIDIFTPREFSRFLADI